MGVERTVNINKAMKLVGTTAEQVNKEDKESIINIFSSNTKVDGLDKKDLKTLFVLWGKYIPQHKQSINCGSCQNAVYNFWHRVNDHWSE